MAQSAIASIPALREVYTQLKSRMDRAVEWRVRPLRPRIRLAARIGTQPGEPYAHCPLGAAVAATVIVCNDGSPWRAVIPMAREEMGAIIMHHAVKAV